LEFKEVELDGQWFQVAQADKHLCINQPASDTYTLAKPGDWIIFDDNLKVWVLDEEKAKDILEGKV
jgi:hypothetical protein